MELAIKYSRTWYGITIQSIWNLERLQWTWYVWEMIVCNYIKEGRYDIAPDKNHNSLQWKGLINM